MSTPRPWHTKQRPKTDIGTERAHGMRIEDELARRGIHLRGKNERIGPCPKCGGDDRFSINVAKQVFNCRGCETGGDVIDLVQFLDGVDFVTARNLLSKDQPPFAKRNGKHAPAQPKAVISESSRYEDKSGATLLVVDRIEYQNPDGSFVLKDGKRKKTFRQKQPDPHRPGAWLHNVNGVGVVPYRLPALIEAIGNNRTIFVVEGERKADVLAEWGLPATCNAGGAGKWTEAHASFLKDADMVILPDNDAAGRNKHAQQVAESLTEIASRIRILELPGLPEKGDIVDWKAQGHTREEFNSLVQSAPDWHAEEPHKNDTSGTWKFHTGKSAAPPRWLIKNILPETGVALMSGQWGTFKTTTAIYICVSVMTGQPFAGRYRVKRRGAVLFIALEGEHMLSSRLTIIAGHHGVTGALPFAWRGDCPPLTDESAVESLCALADEAGREIMKRFNLPIAAIFVDTVITAAQHKEGGDNDTAASQRVMSALSALSKHTGALVLGVDHFGKVLETGTRGSSAKEGAADTVLSLLADRELSGGVKNTRLAVRKQRDGLSGFEIPFIVHTVETATDEDGDPITAQVIDWQAPQRPPRRAKRAGRRHCNCCGGF